MDQLTPSNGCAGCKCATLGKFQRHRFRVRGDYEEEEDQEGGTKEEEGQEDGEIDEEEDQEYADDTVTESEAE